jgi:FkbM family methyltransferase
MTTLKKTLKQAFGAVAYRLRPGKPEKTRQVTIPLFHQLQPGDIAIDCGANLGAITKILGANGATVHAFEPNPDAFRVLTEQTTHLPNVHRHPAAVLDRAGEMTLYLHVNYALNPERFSSRSSLIAEKRNVDEDHGVKVPVIDLVAFILGLDRPVKLLKVDIEGAEYDLLNALIDRGAMDRIEAVFVETHAHSIPSLVPVDKALRQKIADRGLAGKIDLNWS